PRGARRPSRGRADVRQRLAARRRLGPPARRLHARRRASSQRRDRRALSRQRRLAPRRGLAHARRGGRLVAYPTPPQGPAQPTPTRSARGVAHPTPTRRTPAGRAPVSSPPSWVTSPPATV